MADIAFRPAKPKDAEAVAHLHATVWSETCRELAPPEAFAALDEAHRLRGWRERLANPIVDQLVLLAEADGRLVGMGAAGAASDPLYGGRGEIKFVYIDRNFQGQGIGRQLLRRLAQHLKARHYPGVVLGVVDGNEAAIGFYQALGGRAIARQTDPGPIWRSENIIIAWDNCDDLTR